MLDDASLAHLISWNADGASFTVHDAARFASEVLPMHFKHNKLTSFTRQASIYGFVKSSKLCDYTFSHPHFVRDAPSEMALITRRASRRAAPSPGAPASAADAAVSAQLASLSEHRAALQASVQNLEARHRESQATIAALQRENAALASTVADLESTLASTSSLLSALHTQALGGAPAATAVASAGGWELPALPVSLKRARDAYEADHDRVDTAAPSKRAHLLEAATAFELTPLADAAAVFPGQVPDVLDPVFSWDFEDLAIDAYHPRVDARDAEQPPRLARDRDRHPPDRPPLPAALPSVRSLAVAALLITAAANTTAALAVALAIVRTGPASPPLARTCAQEAADIRAARNSASVLRQGSCELSLP